MDSRFGSVAKRNERQIEKLANAVRTGLGVGLTGRISMQPIFEFALDDLVEDAYYTIENDGDLQGAEGRTDWHRPVVALSASTYAQLKKGDPRARMTVAHEIGHLLMHTQQPVFYYRSASRSRHVDPEWQANVFAAILLMPSDAFRKMRTVSQAMAEFGVSRAAALRRARSLNSRLIDDKVRQSPRTKKGHSASRTP